MTHADTVMFISFSGCSKSTVELHSVELRKLNGHSLLYDPEGL